MVPAMIAFPGFIVGRLANIAAAFLHSHMAWTCAAALGSGFRKVAGRSSEFIRPPRCGVAPLDKRIGVELSMNDPHPGIFDGPVADGGDFASELRILDLRHTTKR